MNKDSLLHIIQSSEELLLELKKIDYDGLTGPTTELESSIKEFKEGGDNLLSKDGILQIGIVGQVKAGKSSFLNSLFFNGENVLPKASTPMTAGLTVIEYSDMNTFEVEYFTENDWAIFEKQNEEFNKRYQEVLDQNPGAPDSIIRKELERRTSEKVRSAHEMVSSCSAAAKNKIGCQNDCKDYFDLYDLQNVLEQYVGANGEFTSVVKSLYVKMHDERLKGLRIVDTPGVNDPVVSRENRTRTFLHSCHGVFLLSASSDFLGSGDVSFLNTRIGGSGIGTVVLLASKFDSVLQDIGAEREMKQEGLGDLAEIAEMQTKKFKRRLRELSGTIDENLRGRIKLDTTSGIGFSIANKPSAKWDETENKVVQQMKRFYPDYFSSEEDIKETFSQLSNIADIREKYLEGLFLDNRDSIIAEKVSAFFVVNKKSVSSTIDALLSDFKVRQEQLNETTIAEIEKQKELQSCLFENLKSTFSSIFTNFSRNIQNEVKHISNNVRFNEIRSIPTEMTKEAITYKGMLWGHNTNEIEMEHVNTFALCSTIESAVSDYGTSWNNEWQKIFENARNEMSDKLNQSITEFEKQVMSSSFKDTYYRTLIDKALDALRDNRELAIGSIISTYQRQGDDIANKQFYPSGTDELKIEQVPSYLSRCLRDHNSSLISSFRILTDSIQEDVKNEINKNLDKAILVIEDMKVNFSDNLKREGQEYLNDLEKDMEEKTSVLKKLDSIISTISKLSQLYN